MEDPGRHQPPRQADGGAVGGAAGSRRPGDVRGGGREQEPLLLRLLPQASVFF